MQRQHLGGGAAARDSPTVAAAEAAENAAHLKKKAATNWVFMSGDANISYFLGTNSTETRPQTILAGDSNVTGGGGGLDPHWSTFLGTSIDAAWDATLHVRCGNLALSDGSVQQSTTPSLRDQITACWAAGLTNVVFSKPRGVF